MLLAPLLLLIPVADQAALPSAHAESNTARYLVVIGHNGGAPDPRTPLSFADDDAARLFTQLAPSTERAWLLSTFDRESAKAFPDLTDVAREPTRKTLAQALGEAQWLIRQQKTKGRGTELIFAFAGHGDVDDAGEGYVVLADGPFSRTDLMTQVLEPSSADINHVIIDACASYFMVKSRGGADSGSVPLSPRVLDVLSGQTRDAALRARTGLLVSTSNAAEVHESSELASGVFSFLLRSALAGAADQNGDGKVEYVEAAAFIASASAALDDPRARLLVHAEPPLQRPHAALQDLARSGADRFLAIDEKGPVHVRLLDARGVPYAELHTNSNRPVLLALVGNPFFIVERGNKEAVLVPRAAGAYALSALSFEESPKARSADAGPSAGPSAGPFAGLFARPYGSDFLDGFLAPSSMAPPLAGPPFKPVYAKAGPPPPPPPVAAIGVTTMGGAALLGLGAGGAVLGNQLAFQRLQGDFETTGQLDPALAVEVEAWRTAATALTVGAVGVGMLGGALYLWSIQLPEGEMALPW